MDSIFSPLYSDNAKSFFKENEKILQQLKKRLAPKVSKRAQDIVKYGFPLNDKIYLNSGDIVYRPLDGLKTDLSLQMNHYGIVFGQMLNGECLILENSDKTNISFKSIHAFAKTKHSTGLDNIRVERKPEAVSFELIIGRATEVEHDFYSGTYFNCRHFVNYCIHGEKISEQVEMVKNILSPIFEILTNYAKATSSLRPSEKDKDIVLQVANKLELIKRKVDETK